jgi:hypothetical protein
VRGATQRALAAASNRYPRAAQLGGEALRGEWLVWSRLPDIRRRRGALFPDRGGCPLSLRIVMGETSGLEDHGPQLGDAAATSVVEVHKWT